MFAIDMFMLEFLSSTSSVRSTFIRRSTRIARMNRIKSSDECIWLAQSAHRYQIAPHNPGTVSRSSWFLDCGWHL